MFMRQRGCLLAGQLAWTTECEKGLTEVEKGDKGGLKLVKKKWIQMLNKYSEMVRGGLSKGDRGKLVAVITIEARMTDHYILLHSFCFSIFLFGEEFIIFYVRPHALSREEA
jgi:hypothetical protein